MQESINIEYYMANTNILIMWYILKYSNKDMKRLDKK